MTYGGPQEGHRWEVKDFVYDPGRGGSRRRRVPRSSEGVETRGERYLVPAVAGRRVGDRRMRGHGVSSEDVPQPGERRRLAETPVGMPFHARELRPGAGGVRMRAPGTAGVVVNRSEGLVRVRLPSGEERRVPEACTVTMGRLAENPVLQAKGGLRRRGMWKAGRSRWLGRRPTVRGVVRNPMDHPHGGGEGRTSGGRPAVTPWSRPKGARTSSQRGAAFVVVPRPRG